MTPAELPPVLAAVGERASRAAPDAATAMAYAYHRHLTGDVLRRYTHPPRTKTPSPPGGPPALVTGTLRRSVRAVAAAGGGPVAMALVAPHTVYARIQELGGHIYPKHTTRGGRPGFLRWTEDGVTHYARHVYLPPRPYMAICTRETIANGSLHRAAVAAFEAAVRA